jgi:hypothetical protein
MKACPSRGSGDVMWLLRLLNRLFHGPAWLTFFVMGLAVGGFALCSFNLFELFHANLRLIATYGAMAAFDGGLLQLLELAGWGYLALALFVLFKGCLDGLLHRIHQSREREREIPVEKPPRAIIEPRPIRTEDV